MLLKLDDLKGVASDVNKELKCLRYLKEVFQLELGYRAIGKTLHNLARNVNDVLDEKMIIGEPSHIDVKISMLLECLGHPSDEVRKMAGRLLPENLADKAIFLEEEESVIYAMARRASPNALASFLEQNRSDELLFDIAKDRLNEDVDPERAKRLQKVVDFGPSIDIDDFWYQTTAKNIIDEYGHPIDSPIWINRVVKSTCTNMMSMSGVEIDEEKLYKEITDQLTKTDDEILESTSIFAQMIENLDVDDVLTESYNVKFEKDSDSLFESSTNGEYIEKFETEYKVKYYDVPKSMFISRGLDESMITNQNTISLPGIAYTPHMFCPTERDEKALDRYVKSWNQRVMSRISESLKIKWSMSVEHEGKLSFDIGMK